MKHLYLTPLFLFLIISIASAQDFCGVIRYRYTYYKGKSNKDVTAKRKDIKTEDFYVCGNKFKVYFDGKIESILNGDSLTYFLVLEDSTLIYMKADSAYGEKPPTYGKIKNAVIYKGKTYKSIEERSRGQSITYYFNDEIKIDRFLFRRIEFFHWNKYFEATNGSLRLVSINKRGRLTSVSEVTEIIKMNLVDSDFSPPDRFKIQPGYRYRVVN